MTEHPIHAFVDRLTSNAYKNIEFAMRPIIEHEGEEDLGLYLRNVTLGLEQLTDAECMCRASPDSERMVCIPKIAEARAKIVEKLAEIGVF